MVLQSTGEPQKPVLDSTEKVHPPVDVVSVADDTTDQWKPGKQELHVMLTLAILSLVVALDATIIVTSLPAIARDLHGSTTEAFWVGSSYLLTNAVFQPSIASLSHIFGRPHLLFISVVLFSIGTLIACLAHDFPTLLAGRSLQGIGGGGITCLTQVIFTDIVPLRHRPKWFGIVLGAWAFGIVIGPIVGGLIAQHTTWRWIFYINFPFCGLGLVLVPLLVRMNTSEMNLKGRIARFDFLGAFLSVASTTSFLIAISWGGNSFPWDSWHTIVPMLLGITGFIGFILWQRFGSRDPILHLQLYWCPTAYIAYFSAFVQGLLLYSQLYYLPLYFASAKGRTPTLTGVAVLPTLCLLIPTSIIVGRIITRIGHYRWAIWSGLILETLGTGLPILFNVTTPTAVWAVIMAILGIGHGLLLTALNFNVQASAQEGDSGFAAAQYTFMRSLGMCVGTTIGGTVFQNLMQRKLKHFDLPTSIAKDAEAYLAVLDTLPESVYKLDVLAAYCYGLHGVYAVLTAVSGLTLLASLFIKSFSLDRILVSDHKLQQRRGSEVGSA